MNVGNSDTVFFNLDNANALPNVYIHSNKYNNVRYDIPRIINKKFQLLPNITTYNINLLKSLHLTYYY